MGSGEFLKGTDEILKEGKFAGGGVGGWWGLVWGSVE